MGDRSNDEGRQERLPYHGPPITKIESERDIYF